MTRELQVRVLCCSASRFVPNHTSDQYFTSFLICSILAGPPCTPSRRSASAETNNPGGGNLAGGDNPSTPARPLSQEAPHFPSRVMKTPKSAKILQRHMDQTPVGSPAMNAILASLFANKMPKAQSSESETDGGTTDDEPEQSNGVMVNSTAPASLLDANVLAATQVAKEAVPNALEDGLLHVLMNQMLDPEKLRQRMSARPCQSILAAQGMVNVTAIGNHVDSMMTEWNQTVATNTNRMTGIHNELPQLTEKLELKKATLRELEAKTNGLRKRLRTWNRRSSGRTNQCR